MNCLEIGFQYLWRFYRLLKDSFALEIHVADHCNLNCISCTHYSPLVKSGFVDLEQLKKDLEVLKKKKLIMLFKEIRLMGGEPLLHPNVSDVIRITREFFPPTKIVLVTNGLLMNKMPVVFMEACKKYDIVLAITKYPVNIDLEASIQHYKRNGVKLKVYGDRTQTHAFYQSKLSVNINNSKWENYYKCFDSRCMQLRNGKIYSCPQSAYVDMLNKFFGCNFKHEKEDFISLDKLNCVNLLTFRFKPKPFCKYCVFPRHYVNWGKSERKNEEWISTDKV